jgi:hypothetical protein
MMAARLLSVMVAAAALVGCAQRETPTVIPVPPGAMDLRQFSFVNGKAFQTDFTLRARFPETPALQHYVKVVGDPWVRCEWSQPEWQRFIDGTVTPNQTVHQQIHMWINPGARRTLLLSTRYYSATAHNRVPDNDNQRVVVVEYFGEDTKEVISRLNLKCPLEAVRSNPAPRRDRREAAPSAAPSPAPAGGREP